MIKEEYSAQISRNTPTAFIFLIDHSVSMGSETVLNGEQTTLAEAVAQIVNKQISELVLRCVKADDTRNYYDIAVIGYGHEVYSGWQGELEGRDFVSPCELKEHPYTRQTVREEKRTRKGTVVKEVERVQWISPRCDGNWTHAHKAFAKAKELLAMWLKEYKGRECYPPTIINITDGVFNGATQEEMQRLADELKSLRTLDGNVLLFNIHVTPDAEGSVVFPTDRAELDGDPYSETLFGLSSLLPTRYNQPIATLRQDDDPDARHVAMAVNVDMSTLIQLMDIGTPTNIRLNV